MFFHTLIPACLNGSNEHKGAGPQDKKQNQLDGLSDTGNNLLYLVNQFIDLDDSNGGVFTKDVIKEAEKDRSLS